MVLKNATTRQIFTLLPVYINMFTCGCNIGWFPNAVYFFTSNDGVVSATISECSMMASLIDFAKFVTSIPGGILCDKFGRQKTLHAIGILQFLSWVMLSEYTSIPYIYVARFISGVSLGLIYSIGSMTIAETVPPEVRGRFVAAFQSILSCGMLFEGIICSVFSSYKILAYSALAASSTYFLSVPRSKETPCHLISTSQHDEAKQIYRYLRPHLSQTQLDVEFDKMKLYIDEEKKRKEQQHWLTFVKTKSIRTPLITGALLESLIFATGFLPVINFITEIIPDNDYLDKKYYASIGSCVSIISTMSSIFVIEVLPRRVLYVFGCTAFCLVFASNALSQYLFTQQNVSQCFWLIVAGNLLLRVLWGMLLGPLHFTMKSEIFPQSVRAFGGAICVISGSVSNIIMYQTYKVFHDQCNLCYFYAISAAFSIVVAFVSYIRLPEGRGRCLEDLQTKENGDKDFINVELEKYDEPTKKG